MPKTTVRLPDDFHKKIAQLEQKTIPIIDKALQAGGEVMKGEISGNLKKVVGSVIDSRSTGELLDELRVTPNALTDRNGVRNVKLGFKKGRINKAPHHKTSNAKIANVLEHGRSAKHGEMKPKPFLKPAIKTGRAKTKKVIMETLSEEFKKVIE
jgi:hypothetical protein